MPTQTITTVDQNGTTIVVTLGDDGVIVITTENPEWHVSPAYEYDPTRTTECRIVPNLLGVRGKPKRKERDG